MTRSNRTGGYSLLELLCAVVVLVILASFLAPVAGSFKRRAQSLQCVTNLRGLHVAVNAYMGDHDGVWPQIKGSGSSDTNAQQEEIATGWIETMGQYGISEKSWRCPTIEGRIKANGKPEALKIKRLDYVPTKFGKQPHSAYTYPMQPWFIERTSSHGRGPQILLSRGDVLTIDELLKESLNK